MQTEIIALWICATVVFSVGTLIAALFVTFDTAPRSRYQIRRARRGMAELIGFGLFTVFIVFPAAATAGAILFSATR